MSLRKDHGDERIVWTPRSIVETLSHIMSNDSIYISTSENGGGFTLHSRGIVLTIQINLAQPGSGQEYKRHMIPCIG